MSAESYVDLVRQHLAERQEKVALVIDVLRRIVRNHAVFDGHSQGSPMGTPTVRWDQDRPTEHVWLDLYGRGREQINQAHAVSHREHAVHFADLRVDYDGSDMIAMTIEVQPPNVKGYDGGPLTSPQLDGAIADLKRYENALINGNIVN